MPADRIIHYAGGLRFEQGRNVVHILPGWAACCFGRQAERIRAERANSYDPGDVTCRVCRKRIDSANRLLRVEAALEGKGAAL